MQRESGQPFHAAPETDQANRAVLLIVGSTLVLAIAALCIRLFASNKLISDHRTISLWFLGLIALSDLLWFVFVTRKARKPVYSRAYQSDIRLHHEQDQTAHSQFRLLNRAHPSPFRTLNRIQAAIAWLIYHTAAIPFLLLAERANSLISARSYLLIQIAFLMIGLIPVVSMMILDRLFQSAKNHQKPDKLSNQDNQKPDI